MKTMKKLMAVLIVFAMTIALIPAFPVLAAGETESDKVVLVGIEIRVGQLPGFVGIVGYSNLEIVQIDRLVRCVVKLYPRIGEIVQIVHQAVYV